MDAILKNNFKNILAGYELVKDYTVSGSAITSYDLTGLNITKDDDYMLVSDVINALGIDAANQLYANENYTNSNYYTQLIYASSTSIGASRLNQPRINDTTLNTRNISLIKIKLTNNGYIVFQSKNTRNYGSSSIVLANWDVSSIFTATSITSLRYRADQTNGIGIGSRFQLYKRVAPIVYDYTVTGSAITQLDITGLEIDENSEYMLVSDIINPTTSIMGYSLFANGNNTSTNYYRQELGVDSTTVSAGRANDGVYAICEGTVASNKAFFITNIKLTNNGYFIKQSKGMIRYGSSSISIKNEYNTSTFTATSITQLSVVAGVTNGIGIGSRFQLIKLK